MYFSDGGSERGTMKTVCEEGGQGSASFQLPSLYYKVMFITQVSYEVKAPVPCLLPSEFMPS